jgi:2-polyprenyl-6-methoxyphenol hydroxylase-like FAD-dependent oxidoreductase
MQNFDVIVVGGGPTGMTLAGDLARAGRSVAVLERWSERHPSSRAFATHARTLELLDRRGLAEPLLALGQRVPRVNLWPGAAVRLDQLDSHFPFGFVTPQTNVDRLLESYANAQGASIQRGVEVIGLDLDADGVTVTSQCVSGGERSFWRAAYVVGADGAHSTVRTLLGIEFPGKSVLSSVILADLLLEHPPSALGLTLGSTHEVFGFLAPYGDGWYRSMTWDRRRQLPRESGIDDAEISEVLERALGRPMGVREIRWRSRFSCDERQVRAYRHGRVFLAGDAAHVHSPMGGQGMNTGIQDAVNLAWKLDLVLSGASDAILDTYQRERHPIGRRVLLQSGAMMRAITLRRRATVALRELLGRLLFNFRPFADWIAASFSGIGLRYPRGPGQHALVGTRADRVPLVDGVVARQQPSLEFLLVREQGAPPLPTRLGQAERADAGPALLVRPDGYVAWAGRHVAPAHSGDWRHALASWTGRRDHGHDEQDAWG